MRLTGHSSTFGISESQLEEVKGLADSWTLESAKMVCPPLKLPPGLHHPDAYQAQQRVDKALKIHMHDPNFPYVLIQKFKEFTGPCAPNPLYGEKHVT